MFFEARTHFQFLVKYHLANFAMNIESHERRDTKCDPCRQDPLMLPPMAGPVLPLPPPVVWNVDADLFEIAVAVPDRETQPASRVRD